MSSSPKAVLRPVGQRLQLDTDALLEYLKGASVVQQGCKSDEVRMMQFGHGQSNPTYRIQIRGKELVLRKQPSGKLLASAHAVDREFTVMAALASTPVPVPRMISLCRDTDVLGTKFYLMDFVNGRLFLDPSLPSCSAAQRSATYKAMCESLAALHSVDPARVGLAKYGNSANFNARQTARWLRQYDLSTTPATGNPRQASMLQLAEWLHAQAPERDAASGREAIVHGDFRLDNLIFEEQSDASAGTSVAAVLDWELSTLGDPMSDLAYNCLVYHLPASVSAIGRLPVPLPPGIPSEASYRDAYCALRGITPPDTRAWTFYISLSIFRAAAILAGVHTRALQGNASASNAAAVGAPHIVADLAQTALSLIQGLPSSAPPGTLALAPPNASAAAPSRAAAGGPPPSPRCAALLTRLNAFMSQHVMPADVHFAAHVASEARWAPFPLMEALKQDAQREGLWNLWIPQDLGDLVQPAIAAAGLGPQEAALLRGHGLTNVDYAHLARAMGEVTWCPEVFNCSAPDTGNMEVLGRYGSLEQQVEWLVPLLQGGIRSCFAMTEPGVASSDATNIEGTVQSEGEEYVVHGRKIWISGACDSRCRIAIFMGKSDPAAPRHKQQCMILVPLSTRGVRIVRPMTVFGQDDAPHGHAEMLFDHARVPRANMILGAGRGFEIAQGRLGPGRLHHCMRSIGIGDAALRLLALRVSQRKAFGDLLARSPLVQSKIAEAWLQLHTAWLSVVHAASELDRVGNKRAQLSITAAKAIVPNAVLAAIDVAIQLHGAAGVGQDTKLAGYWGAMRTLRLADGPDEVHLMSIGRSMIKSVSKL